VSGLLYRQGSASPLSPWFPGRADLPHLIPSKTGPVSTTAPAALPSLGRASYKEEAPHNGAFLSGRRDSNSGPLVPQTSALTRLRHAPRPGHRSAHAGSSVSSPPAPDHQSLPVEAAVGSERKPCWHVIRKRVPLLLASNSRRCGPGATFADPGNALLHVCLCRNRTRHSPERSYRWAVVRTRTSPRI
jgi:hypothetical protein